MKKNATFLFNIFVLTLLISCGSDQTDNNSAIKQETPQALQDEHLDIKSYTRSNSDLTEELYQEIVEKSPSLKKLEANLEAFQPKPYELGEKFSKYDRKSNSYYNSVNYKAEAISDSMLRKKIVSLITNSKNLYSNKTADLNSLLKIISQKGTTLNDHHSVLKIVLTLPIIEKYQNDNLPDKKELKTLIKEQNKLIERIDSLTTKY